MKTIAVPLLALISLVGGNAAFAQVATNSNAGGVKPAAGPQSDAAKPELAIEELEAKFRATLTNATFSGRWCSVKDGQLGPEKEDKYTLLGASKIGGDLWLIQARIQYGERDFVAPIPVKVKWAGDTPVITVDNLAMPGGNTKYSARVLIYDNTYAGRWSGGDHGGLLSGVITNRAQ